MINRFNRFKPAFNTACIAVSLLGTSALAALADGTPATIPTTPPDFSATLTGTQGYAAAAVSQYGPGLVGIMLAPLVFHFVWHKIKAAIA